MELTYKQLEMTLQAHLQIAPDRLPTFKSRIKQLQRLEFPSGVNIGRGVKMTYTVEHLFKLAIAFELIGLGLAALAVKELVERHWTEFSAAVALDILNKRDWGGDIERRVFVRLILQSMHEIQFWRYGDPAASTANVEDYDFLVGVFQKLSVARRTYCAPILMISDIVDRIKDVAADVAGVTGIISTDEVHAWLPQGKAAFVHFKGRYPDRSNLKMRQHLNALYGNDPDSKTPDGAEEAREFLENNYRSDTPF